MSGTSVIAQNSISLMSTRLNDNFLFYHNSRYYSLCGLLYLREYTQSDQRLCYAIPVEHKI